MTDKTKQAISRLTAMLDEPDERTIELDITRASFAAAAGLQRALNRRAPDATIADLAERLAEFPRHRWEEIRQAAESMIRRTSSGKDTPGRLAALGEVWKRVLSQVGTAGA